MDRDGPDGNLPERGGLIGERERFEHEPFVGVFHGQKGNGAP